MKHAGKSAGFGLLFCIFFMVSPSYGQSTKESLAQAIQSKHYIFKAQSALPMRGGLRQLTSEYDLKVNGDTITAYLPYFGRAYVAPIDPSKGGIQFTTAQSDYNVKSKKKSWEVTLVPKNIDEVRQLFLSISSSGSARLQVISNMRDPISFNGYVEVLKDH